MFRSCGGLFSIFFFCMEVTKRISVVDCEETDGEETDRNTQSLSWAQVLSRRSQTNSCGEYSRNK